MGVEDGGPGLPVTGWSTTGGDLRVAHFVGLHGLQELPLFGYLLALLAPEWLRMRHRVALVWLAGVSYLCLIGLLTWQALRGQPVISPNARTLGALLALLLAAGTAVFAVVLQARRGRWRLPGRIGRMDTLKGERIIERHTGTRAGRGTAKEARR